LTHEEICRNAKVSSDRVLVENYFGRLCIWKIMYTTYKWKRDSYDLYLQFCIALTNFHISLQPLRADTDQAMYTRVLSRFASMALTETRRRERKGTRQKERRVRNATSLALERASEASNSNSSGLQERFY
jgi:hypothetical protein